MNERSLIKLSLGLAVVTGLGLAAGTWFVSQKSAQRADDITPITETLGRVSASLQTLTLDQKTLSEGSVQHDARLNNLTEGLRELKTLVAQLQTQVSQSPSTELSTLQTELREQALSMESLTQRVKTLETARLAAQKQAVTHKRRAQAKSQKAKTPVATTGLAVKPNTPSIQLETIDSFGGKLFAVVVQHGKRRFLSQEDQVDGWKLQQISDRSARFQHPTGASLQLNRPH